MLRVLAPIIHTRTHTVVSYVFRVLGGSVACLVGRACVFVCGASTRRKCFGSSCVCVAVHITEVAKALNVCVNNEIL